MPKKGTSKMKTLTERLKTPAKLKYGAKAKKKPRARKARGIGIRG